MGNTIFRFAVSGTQHTQNMELDMRSRCWIITYKMPVVTDKPQQLVGDGTSTPKFAHIKVSAENDSVSVWLSYDNAQRASAVTNAFDKYEMVVLKRTTQSAYGYFKDIPHTVEHIITHPNGNGHTNTDNVLDPPQVVVTDEGTDSDTEMVQLVKQRTALKRKIKSLSVLQDELIQINKRICEKCT